MYVCMYVCIYMYIYLYNVYMYIYLCVCVCMHVYVCRNVCILIRKQNIAVLMHSNLLVVTARQKAL